MLEERIGDPHTGEMGDDQGRDAQAQHELKRLDRLPAKFAALVKRHVMPEKRETFDEL